MYERGLSRCLQRLRPLARNDRYDAGDEEEYLIQQREWLASTFFRSFTLNPTHAPTLQAQFCTHF